MPLQFPAQGEGGGGCCCVLGHFQSIDCVQHSLNTLSQMILACNNITTAQRKPVGHNSQRVRRCYHSISLSIVLWEPSLLY